MSHAIWKGHISFGLVNIPVVLYSAEKPNDLHFKLLDSKNLAKIHYQRVNEDTGKEVAWDNIVKGYEYDDGQYVVLTNEDFDEVASKNLKLIEIEDFIPKDAISFVFFETPYYLLPDKRGEKGYVLLREILSKTKKVGIARVMIRSRQYLAAIIPYGDAVVLNIIRYAHELKKPKEFELPDKDIASYKISKKEMEIAQQLVESMTTSWKPEHYKDEYHDALLKLIDTRVASGKQISHKKSKKVTVKQTNVVDFMELLKKSVQQKKKTASKDVSHHDKKSPNKKKGKKH